MTSKVGFFELRHTTVVRGHYGYAEYVALRPALCLASPGLGELMGRSAA